MLGSISSIQPVVHAGFSPQHTAENEKTNNPEEKNKNSLQSAPSESTQKATDDLSQQDVAKIQQLKKRDTEVKTHEQAHKSAAGSLALGAPSFSYTTGPNGVRYATGGEVGIDTSKIDGDPAATLQKADIIRRAALAPASPSSQDRLVASKANAMAKEARTDLVELTQEKKAESKEARDVGQQEESDKKDTTVEKENNSSANTTPGTLIDLSV